VVREITLDPRYVTAPPRTAALAYPTIRFYSAYPSMSGKKRGGYADYYLISALRNQKKECLVFIITL